MADVATIDWRESIEQILIDNGRGMVREDLEVGIARKHGLSRDAAETFLRHQLAKGNFVEAGPFIQLRTHVPN